MLVISVLCLYSFFIYTTFSHYHTHPTGAD